MNGFLHIGEKVLLQGSEIIGIFRASASNKGFTAGCAEAGTLRNTSEISRSFVLVRRADKNLVYQSKISAGRLINRLNSSEGLDGKTEESEEGKESG